MHHVGEIDSASYVKAVADQKTQSPLDVGFLKQPVPEPEGQGDPLGEEHLQVAELAPSIGGEGKHAAPEEARPPAAAAPAQDIAGGKTREDEGEGKPEVVGRRGPREDGLERVDEEGGPQPVIGKGEDPGGGMEEGRIPDVSQPLSDLMADPFEEIEVEEGVSGVGAMWSVKSRWTGRRARRVKRV